MNNLEFSVRYFKNDVKVQHASLPVRGCHVSATTHKYLGCFSNEREKAGDHSIIIFLFCEIMYLVWENC